MKPILLTAICLTILSNSFAQNNSKMKNINQNAPVKCSRTITINANSEKVWKVLTEIDSWANWQTDIKSSKINGELRPSTTFDWKTGGAKIHSTLQTLEKQKQLGWTGKSFGILAIHTWTLSEEDGKTTLVVDESMQGFLAGLFKKSLNKKLQNGMQTWLDLLKVECEK